MQGSEESLDLAWVDMATLESLGVADGLLRMRDKCCRLCSGGFLRKKVPAGGAKYLNDNFLSSHVNLLPDASPLQ